MSIRAVLFELGGTLVEYEAIPWEELEAPDWRRPMHTWPHFAIRKQTKARFWRPCVARTKSSGSQTPVLTI